jgi:hypothetical protein
VSHSQPNAYPGINTSGSLKVRSFFVFILAGGLALLTLAVSVRGAEVPDTTRVDTMEDEVSAVHTTSPTQPPRNSTRLSYTSEVTSTSTFTTYIPIVVKDYVPPLYSDDFSDPNSGWYIEYLGCGKFSYQDEEYEIWVRCEYTMAGATSPFGSFSNYAIEADMRRHMGGSVLYGLIFDFVDWDHFYVFIVDPDHQSYILQRRNPTDWTVLIWPVGSPYINPDEATNRLKVKREGNQITLYVNGHFLTSIEDGTYTGNLEVGLYAESSGLDVITRFDNFKIWQLDTTATVGEVSILQEAGVSVIEGAAPVR